MNRWVARNCVYRPATWLRGEPVFGLLRDYERSQWWTPEAIAHAQERDLEAILRYAATNTRYYHELAVEAGLDPARIGADDLERLPILTKAKLVERAPDLRAKRLPGTTSWKTTGGSTGVPVRLQKNRFATAAEQAASWRSYGWYGIRPGDRQARFWGTPLAGAAQRRSRAIDWVLNRERFSAFAFRREDLAGYFERVKAMRPDWAYGYVSMLAEFARFCLEENLGLARLGIRAVVTTSEVLSSSDRVLITEAFGAPVFNEYGCGEVGAVLYECEKGLLHLMAENLFVEQIPAPTPDQPEASRLIVTDLHNRATPLIRYEVGDRVVAALPCDCGRGLPAFREVFGRAYDFVEASDGTRFHGEFFLYHLEEARDAGVPFQQVQFVQTDRRHIVIRIVIAPGYREEHGTALAHRLEEESGQRFEVSTEIVPKLRREASGKLRLIRSIAPADVGAEPS
jgi:phenylacetate-CoA ligase